MLRELLMGLTVVFMASSVIISNIFRSTRSDKRQLPAKNISNNTCTTAGLEVPAPEPESNSLSRNQSYF
jgi:lactate dehydrogenase-like 2-hydroxyacid dehydrogenase